MLRHALVILAAVPAAVGAAGEPALLIRGATLIDGTGQAGRRADVRVAGDTIVEVAPALDPAAGERVIEAAGLVLAPGFIDTHSHADRGLEEMPGADTQLRQGITTAVVGQDGSS
jgi:N-acyl-D-amino-acid deacylase